MFLTLTPPHQAANPITLDAWTTKLLKAAGIDKFKLHSTHSASASGAPKVGVPVGDVLIRGGWANLKNFFKYYAQTVQVDHSVPAVFKEFFKMQDSKGVHHYAPAGPTPVAATSGGHKIMNQNHPYLFTGVSQDTQVPLQYRKCLKVMVPKAAPVKPTVLVPHTRSQSAAATASWESAPHAMSVSPESPTIPPPAAPAAPASAPPPVVPVTSFPIVLLDHHLTPPSVADDEPESMLQTVEIDELEVDTPQQLLFAEEHETEGEDVIPSEQVVQLTPFTYPSWEAVITTVPSAASEKADMLLSIPRSDNKVKYQRVFPSKPVVVPPAAVPASTSKTAPSTWSSAAMKPKCSNTKDSLTMIRVFWMPDILLLL